MSNIKSLSCFWAQLNAIGNVAKNADKTFQCVEAIVIGGLEPMLQGDEVYNLISYFRSQKNNTLFIIYTGYTEEECKKMEWFQKIILLGRVIFKFGRYIPNKTKKYDELLGVTLASDNQYSRYYEGDETSNNND